MPEVHGYADLHCHPMAHLGFGGGAVAVGAKRLFWGTPDPAGAPDDPIGNALPCCDPAHGLFNNPNVLPRLIESGGHGRGASGFEDWPRFDTILHQQMYFEGIRRAHLGGLRLICALAVHNRMLASMYGYPDGTDLRDSTALNAQTRAMREFAARHSSWMEIVTSPAAARACIANNKLAVVLGVEVDSLGNWRSEASCTDEQVDTLVAFLHQEGIRAVTPIHLANNAFGGCSFSNDQFNFLNHFLGDGHGKSKFFEIVAQPESANGIEFLLDTDAGRTAALTAYLHMIRSRPDPGVDMDYPNYRAVRVDGHRNKAGMTPRGRRLVGALMRHGMLLDVDHMSDASREDVFSLVESREYPVYSSHTSVRDLGLPRAPAETSMHGVASEGALQRRTLERIRDLKGMCGAMTRQGPTKQHDATIPATSRVFPHSTSLSWIHNYLFCRELMPDGVAIGTDFNGFAQQPGPRFHDGEIDGPNKKIAYDDVEKQVLLQTVLTKFSLGVRKFDYNKDGLAHYGLIPDFLRDVANVLDGEDRLTALFRSAERFIHMWELCESKAGAP